MIPHGISRFLDLYGAHPSTSIDNCLLKRCYNQIPTAINNGRTACALKKATQGSTSTSDALSLQKLKPFRSVATADTFSRDLCPSLCAAVCVFRWRARSSTAQAG